MTTLKSRLEQVMSPTPWQREVGEQDLAECVDGPIKCVGVPRELHIRVRPSNVHVHDVGIR